MIDLDAIKARLAAVHAAGISVIHTRLADHGIRVLVSMRDWSGNNRYDADTAVTTLIGNAPADIGALVAEVDRLRALEADAERVLVKADLWSYYEAFVEANGAGSITELVVQRDEARTEAVTMRTWAEEAAKAENENAEDARRERAAVVAWLRREVDDDADSACILAYAAKAIERGEHRPGGYPANNKKFAEKVQEQLRRDDKADQFRSNMSRFATSLRKESSAQNLMDEHQMDNIQRGEHRREGGE